MSDTSAKEWLKRVRQAVLTVLVVAVAVRVAWVLLAPVLPELVSLAVVLTVLGVAVYGRRSK
jgi:hypothetical protein